MSSKNLQGSADPSGGGFLRLVGAVDPVVLVEVLPRLALGVAEAPTALDGTAADLALDDWL